MKQTLQKTNWAFVLQSMVMVGVAVVALASFAPNVSNAQLINQFQNNCPTGTGLRCQGTSLTDIFKTIINWALGIAFALAVIYLIYGGFLYITSAGNEESATKGKNAVIYALIGIIIIILSYVIVNVIANLAQGNGGGGFFGGGGGP